MIEFRPALVQLTSITAAVLFAFAGLVIGGLGGAVAILRVLAGLVMVLCVAYVWQITRLCIEVEPSLVRVRSWRSVREYRRDEAVAIPAEMRMIVGNAESLVLRRRGQRVGGYRIALDDFPKADRYRLEEAILGALRPTHGDDVG